MFRTGGLLGVHCEQSCPCCASAFENEWHCFIGCEAAQERLDSDKMNRIVMLLWSIWWRRNQKYWSDVFPSAFEVNRRARGALDDWSHVRRQPAHISQNANNIMQQRWTKPQQGNLKCNVDAACYVAENRYNIGACIRDDRSRFVKAMSAQFVGQPAVHEAEAQGLLITLNWLQQMQISSIEIEMDCLQVVQNIEGKLKNLTEFGILIGKCKTSLNLIHNSVRRVVPCSSPISLSPPASAPPRTDSSSQGRWVNLPSSCERSEENAVYNALNSYIIGQRRRNCAAPLEFTSYHNEHESSKGKKPEVVEFGSTCTDFEREPLILNSKAPRWHEQLLCWCLHFKGRVTVALVKNFQLVAAEDPWEEKVILQFGKIGDDTFTMDYWFLGSIDDLIHEILTVGPHFREANNFLWPFKLKAPLP
ncbi:unnamed protein product [Trifolium pratense]|uniref:Uncharacterized protein n=1 Tax=Trifolium pratense TaxID=57577 RepID=A0ACB0M2T5_TRIPR|nr:unnamed protein product [Trifolium pratense]